MQLHTFAASSVRLLTAVTSLSLIVSLTACLSPEERQARQAWALDVSGGYTQADVDPAGTLAIENENDKNDVKLTFTRGALEDGEQAILDRVSDETERAALAETLVMGLGESQLWGALAGGENISRDFGESSEVWVASEAIALEGSIAEATDGNLRYYTHLTIENGTDALQGTFSLVVSERRPDPTMDDPENTSVFTETFRHTIRFSRDDGAIEGEICDGCTGEDAPDTEDDPGEDGVPTESTDDTEADAAAE